MALVSTLDYLLEASIRNDRLHTGLWSGFKSFNKVTNTIESEQKIIGVLMLH